MRRAHDQLIAVAEAARHLGLKRSILAKQVRSGLIRSHNGKVYLSEVLTDRIAYIDNQIANGRSLRPGGGPQSTTAAEPLSCRRNSDFKRPSADPKVALPDPQRKSADPKRVTVSLSGGAPVDLTLSLGDVCLKILTR